MADTARPENAGAVADLVTWAVGKGTSLDIAAGGTKRGVGQPAATDMRLDASALSGVTFYEPNELVLAAGPATPLAEIQALLADNGQQLAFEPPELGPVLGSNAASTIGGVMAGNLSGPRRIRAGAARDSFLGIEAVSGRGEPFKSGGRVVKNVTGYDLPRALAGSWGTLCVMTEVTLKVLPAAETETSIVLPGLDPDTACAAMSAALGSAFDVSAAAHLPDGADGADGSATVLRLEGIAPSVRSRADSLTALLKAFAAPDRLTEKSSRALWRRIRDLDAYATDTARPLWRLSVPPRQGGTIANRLVNETGGRIMLDWGGGLIWLELDGKDARENDVRGALNGVSGHATLMRASDETRGSIACFQPQPAPLAELSKRLKVAFDPKNILNPGRMGG